MIFFGHRFLKNELFYHVLDAPSVGKTPASSTVYIEFNEDAVEIMKHAKESAINIATKVSTITELMYASFLGAKYIIVSSENAKTSQTIAENYLFDAKILVCIKDEKEIEEFAILGIDGVIFSDGVIKVNA